MERERASFLYLVKIRQTVDIKYCMFPRRNWLWKCDYGQLFVKLTPYLLCLRLIAIPLPSSCDLHLTKNFVKLTITQPFARPFVFSEYRQFASFVSGSIVSRNYKPKNCFVAMRRTILIRMVSLSFFSNWRDMLENAIKSVLWKNTPPSPTTVFDICTWLLWFSIYYVFYFSGLSNIVRQKRESLFMCQIGQTMPKGPKNSWKDAQNIISCLSVVGSQYPE